MSTVDIYALATLMDTAAHHGRAIPQLSVTHELTLQQAYAVQDASIKLRIARGESRIGMKMGFTSRAKMQQMGIESMIWGRLTDAMLLEEGAPVSLEQRRFIHPRVEPEVVFLLRAPLRGRITMMQAREAVQAVAPAMEIIDSRYQQFKFSLEDVIADNSSSSGLVLGPWCTPDVDLSNLGVVMRFDADAVQIGSTAAILGNPWRSLVAAAQMADDAGEELPAGSIVLAGGATAATYLQPDTYVSTEIQHLGKVSFHVRA